MRLLMLLSAAVLAVLLVLQGARLKQMWPPLPWWLKAPIALVGLTGLLVLLQVVSLGFFTLLGAVTLIALYVWARQATPGKRLGRYGQLHRDQLQLSKPETYRDFQQAGELEEHLHAIDQQAEKMKALVMRQLEKSQPYNPKEWGSREAWMGGLDRIAEELVLNDLVLVPDQETQDAMQDGYRD